MQGKPFAITQHNLEGKSHFTLLLLSPIGGAYLLVINPLCWHLPLPNFVVLASFVST
jgi:hypothetical protein